MCVALAPAAMAPERGRRAREAHTTTPAVLTEPVDVYTSWLDAIEEEQAAGAAGGGDAGEGR